jgi:hypothetical protein
VIGPWTPWILLAAVLFWGGSTGVAYWKGKEHGRDELIAEQSKHAEIRAETLQVAQSAVAGDLARIDGSLGDLDARIAKAMRTDRRYTDCRHTPDSMRLIREAFDDDDQPTGSDAAPASDMRRAPQSAGR